jgi:hypothetical protein
VGRKLEMGNVGDAKASVELLRFDMHHQFLLECSTIVNVSFVPGFCYLNCKEYQIVGLIFSGAFLFITFFPDQAEKLLQMSPIG